MFDVATQALIDLFTPERFALMMLGVFLGMLLGALPGIGALAGLAILLPFTFTMEPGSAFALMMGLMAVGATTDTIPAVLFGVPGSSGAQATIMDGYPLAKQGQAGRALGAAYTASMLGGLIGALTLALVLPVFRPIALGVGSPDLFMITMLGIAMVAVLSGTAPIKGLLAGAFGLIIGLIGSDPRTGVVRWDLGSLYLFSGVPTVPVFLGLFGLPEIAELMVKRSQISAVPRGKLVGVRQGVFDALRHWKLVVRTSLFGAIFGALPGVGKAVIDWLAYGHAMMTEKGARKTFGKGDIRGVIAPESSNNAIDGGALVPTLVFGVPGHAGMALLLSAFIIHGIRPGPDMLTTNLDITYTLIWTLAIANVIAALVCLGLTPQFAKLSTLRVSLLVPSVVAFMFVGAFSSSGRLGDLYALILFGILGFYMKRFGWSRPALVLGYVLSAASEKYFFISKDTFGWSWLTDTSVIVMMVLIALTLFYGFRTKGRREKHDFAAMVPDSDSDSDSDSDQGQGKAESGTPGTGSAVADSGPGAAGGGVKTSATRQKQRPRLTPDAGLSVFAIVVFGVGILLTRDWPSEARFFPLAICVPALVLAVVQLLLDVLRPESSQSKRSMDVAQDDNPLPPGWRGELLGLAPYVWLVGFLLLTFVLGIYVAIPAFAVLFLRGFGRETWKLTTIYTVSLGGGTWFLFDQVLAVQQPLSMLSQWLGY